MIAQFVETKNYAEIYNAYAMWIQMNPQYFRTGKTAIGIPLDQVKKPHGFRSFLKQSIFNEKKLIRVEQDCSEYLNKYPESMQKDGADLFVKIFPGVIRAKMDKKEEKQQATNNSLNEFFNQTELPLNKSTSTVSTVSKLSDVAETICAFAERGAKSIKSPDGWEVQF